MYRQFGNRGRNRFRFSRFNGRGFSSRKVNKSFDPSSFIAALNSDISSEEFNRGSSEQGLIDYVISHSFNDFQISEKLKENISAKGYKTPTPIQDQAIPPILEGKDLIGIANTGTGKTAAFLVPLLEKVSQNRGEKVLIVAPTRELAVQIRDEFYGFSRGLGINVALCIGGENIRRQIRDLWRNPNFVIGTPGRIQDLMRTRNLNLSTFGSVVLDETDRMVDIGFIKDIKFIISQLPTERQSLFFSATVGSKVQEILLSFVRNPITVSVKTKETAENISQTTVRVSDPGSRLEKLHEILIGEECTKVLVFGRTKHGVQKLSDELVKRGFKAGAIHGNKRQSQRARTLESFKRDEINILIATDLASRGLDIPNVSHVINYDLPESKEAYIHRIGRTGRADKKGVALTFVN